MKSLDKLTNKQKAKLLHQWFPKIIPDLLAYFKDSCRARNLPVSARLAAIGYTQIDFCNGLHAVHQLIWLDCYELQKRHHLFTRRLFSDEIFEIVLDLTTRFMLSKRCESNKFVCAVQLLFFSENDLENVGTSIHYS